MTPDIDKAEGTTPHKNFKRRYVILAIIATIYAAIAAYFHNITWFWSGPFQVKISTNDSSQVV